MPVKEKWVGYKTIILLYRGVNMLSKPKHGWSEITIGDWSDRCSYIDDVPFNLLEALEKSCRTHRPVAVKFDAEGWDYIVVFDQFETHIISTNPNDVDVYFSNFDYHTIEIDRDKLAKELIADIRRDIDDWTHWDYRDHTEDYLSERKKDLLALCNVVEKRL